MRPKLTYANVTATLALVIAVGGASAFAATQLPKNSVGTKQLKKNAVTGAKVKNSSLAAADFKAGQLPAGAKGETGPPGQDATNLFAYILDNGGAEAASVHYGSGVTAVSDPAGNNGYTLTFNRSLVNCVIQAVAGYGNPAGESTAEEAVIPVVSMDGFDNQDGPNQVKVFFEDEVGTTFDTAFLVTAFC